MKLHKSEVFIDGHFFEVEYDYMPEDFGDYWTPPSGGEIEIFKIKLGTFDMTDFFLENDELFDKLENEIFKIIQDGNE